MNQDNPIWPRVHSALKELLETREYGAITMDEIAEMAGCSVNTLYRYFGSRDQLFLELLSELDGRYQEAIDKLRSSPPYAFMTSEERLIEWLCEVIDIYCEGQRVAIDYLNRLESPERAAAVREERHAFKDICIELLEEMKRDGFLPEEADSEHLYQHILISIRGVLIEYIMENRNLPVRKVFRVMIRDILSGLQMWVPKNWPKRWRDRAELQIRITQKK